MMGCRATAAKPVPWIAHTWAVEFTVPIQVRSEANMREHFAARHSRFKEHATGIYACWIDVPVKLPLQITLTKLGGKKLDTDNLAGAFKGCRDAIAKRLGLDDGDERLMWKYEQSPGGMVGVRVRIERA